MGLFVIVVVCLLGTILMAVLMSGANDIVKKGKGRYGERH